MDPGELNRRIKLQRPRQAVDDFGPINPPTDAQAKSGSDPKWETFANTYAKIEGLRAKERIRSGVEASEQPYMLTLRYRDDLTTEHRIWTDRGEAMQIESVVDKDGKRVWLEVLAYVTAES